MIYNGKPLHRKALVCNRLVFRCTHTEYRPELGTRAVAVTAIIDCGHTGLAQPRPPVAQRERSSLEGETVESRLKRLRGLGGTPSGSYAIRPAPFSLARQRLAPRLRGLGGHPQRKLRPTPFSLARQRLAPRLRGLGGTPS